MSDKQTVSFNLNDQVQVTLTKYGADVYGEYAAGWLSATNKASGLMLQPSAGTILTLPLWELCAIFGPVLYNGNPHQAFEYNRITVEIDKSIQLADGKIPPLTVCPYRGKCQTAKDDACHHQGEDHITAYSCAIARGYQLFGV